MSRDAADRLRALARDHAAGRLTLEAYRRLRAPLLDGLGAAIGVAPEGDGDSASSVITRPRADITQPRAAWASDSARGDGALVGALAGAAAFTGSSKGRLVAMWVLIVLAGAALIAWRAGLSRHAGSQTRARASDSASSVEAIHALLQPLAASPEWSDARLRALDQALREAGAARIAAAQNTEWFDAFVDQVRSRLREQQALASAPLDAAVSPLAALAVTLGIDPGAPGARAEASDELPSARSHRATSSASVP